ncbi:cell division protein FtsL [Halomonas sp. CUBES01]|uniref:Cell division protein FtsL n=1 Tax=Vreelandella gomseomensis TaxID=370766 RepID=A0ABU1G8W9_9GAMM|nr:MULTISPECIES: cell division protein FtsL [Halomonas]MDR5873940.1 cell division protein FtsL [Halomonas gomseomensis]MEC4767016.1 cell division protein FtsL [Halomonas sp. CUBES01]
MSMEQLDRWLSTLQAEWPFTFRLKPWPVAFSFMFMACLATAFCVVVTTHATRVQYAQLQQLEQEENQLNTEWGQLLLEEGAWSTPARIEQIATQRLGMRIPDVNDVEVIRP